MGLKYPCKNRIVVALCLSDNFEIIQDFYVPFKAYNSLIIS